MSGYDMGDDKFPTNHLNLVLDAMDNLERARHAEQSARWNLQLQIREARHAGHSLAVIAQELGVSRQRIHQISEEK